MTLFLFFVDGGPFSVISENSVLHSQLLGGFILEA